MEASPPKLAEMAVGLLIPPACREEILGDLHERYISPTRYVLDAAYAVPLVIVSRIRRTTDAQVFLMEALVLYVSFLGAAWYTDGSLLNDRLGLLRLAIPAAIALVSLMLADAYAKPGKRSLLQPIQGAALSVGIAFLSQAVLSTSGRELALPRWIMVYGGAMSLLLVSTIRMFFPPVADLPQGASGPAFWLDQTPEPVKISPETIRLLKVLAAIAIVAIAVYLRKRH